MKAKDVLIKCVENGSVKLKRFEHTQRVVAACQEMAAYFDTGTVDLQLLMEAAWLHDVAKDIDDKTHHLPETVKQAVSNYTLDYDLDDITIIISAHKGKAFAPSKYELESAILRMCDKLDKFEKGKPNAEEECQKSLKKIKKSNALSEEEYKKLKMICEEKIQQLK